MAGSVSCDVIGASAEGNLCEEQAERLAFISSCLPGLVYERRLLSDGKVTFPFFAGALLKQLSLDPDLVTSNPALLFARIHPDDVAKFTATVERASSSGSGYALDLRWIDNAGQVVWTRNLAIAQRHAGERRWMCLSVDVTELKASQDAVKSEQSKHVEFMATITHELRSPLHSILGYNELLLMGELREEQRRYVEIGGEASRSLLSIVDEALEYSTVAHAPVSPVTEPFDLAAHLRRVVESFQPVAATKGLRLSINLDPSLTSVVIGDPKRIRQVVTNMLSNAIKYTDTGSVSLSCLMMGGGRFGTRYKIEVCDTGIGIPKAMLPKLFGRFSQADRSEGRRAGGSGLGLSIAKAHVRQLQGEIWVESEEHVGTTVHLELAMRTESPSDSQASAMPLPKASKQILFVDDTPAETHLVREFLRDAPLTVHAAESGLEALEIVAGQTMDLIFMDLNMPIMSGIQTTKLIRALQGPNGTVPIVALTGEISSKTRALCKSNGFNDFIGKPFNRADLHGTIERWA